MLKEALTTGHKVRIDFRNEYKHTAFFVVFDKYTELARMLDSVIAFDLEEWGADGIDYRKIVYVYEEEETLCNGIIEA